MSLLSLIMIGFTAHAQTPTLASGALPPQMVRISYLEPSTRLIAARLLNPAQRVEIKRFVPGSDTPANSTEFVGRDQGYLGVLLEWYTAPRPPINSTYTITEYYFDGSSKSWGPYQYDPQAAQVARAGPGSRVYLPMLR